MRSLAQIQFDKIGTLIIENLDDTINRQDVLQLIPLFLVTGEQILNGTLCLSFTSERFAVLAAQYFSRLNRKLFVKFVEVFTPYFRI